MRVFSGIEEFESVIGQHLGYGDWLEVTQDRVDLFADATDDRQWIHVDPVRAASGPYGGTIAHGYLTVSLLPVLGVSVFRVDGLRMTINYGLNKVRFPQPVRVGSKVRSGATLVSLERTAIGVRGVVDYVVEIEGADKPACVAQAVRLMVP